MLGVKTNTRKFLFLALVLSCIPAAAGNDVTVESIYEELMVICAAHPQFKASSIDFYNPDTAAPFEKEFYERAKKLHKKTTMNYLMQKRKAAKVEQVKCIDNILNTWPG